MLLPRAAAAAAAGGRGTLTPGAAASAAVPRPVGVVGSGSAATKKGSHSNRSNQRRASALVTRVAAVDAAADRGESLRGAQAL